MRWLDSVIEGTNMNLTQLWEAVEDRRAWRSPWGHKESGTTKRNEKTFPSCDQGLSLEGFVLDKPVLASSYYIVF